jgi:endonuclease/exonuclease/phosphatase (EEP) superfamily protein YafD
MDWIAIGLYALGTLVVAATSLPLWHTTRWWVRVWDFPRFQIALLGGVVLLAMLVARPPAGIGAWLFLAALSGAILWQGTWVGPYLPFAPRQVRFASRDGPSDGGLALLTCNVLQTNRNAAGFLDIVGRTDADLVLAVEVDEWWVERLSDGLRATYPHTVLYPLSNGYGLALFSRLELIEPEVRFVFDEAIPSIRTDVRLRSGAIITLYGVHPRPPSVQQDSKERDVELLCIAAEIKARGAPTVVLGDLNDVAWSPTTLNFARAGGLLDPRRGRGFYNTYPARWPGFRYPLDYVFSSEHFTIRTMRVLPRFGSDHLPLIAELSLDPPASG